ncbi:MAG: peptide chain release factor N(5)-glutamine methyltransferase [Burkholderiaceae bacterium]
MKLSATSAGHLMTASRLSQLEARALLSHVSGWRRETLVAFPERELAPEQISAFLALAERRRDGVPLAYLLGRKEFFGRDFQVTPAVLVPRPETELLLELALARLAGQAAPRVLDLGTGSGCIAVTLALECPGAQVVALDVSAAALAVAQRNASELGATVEFRLGSWWAPIAAGETFDLIVSNPPYIARADEHMPALRHEPRLALTDDGDGLACLRALATGAAAHLSPGGWIGLEHGWDQGPATRELLQAGGLVEIGTVQDGAGLDRVSHGQAAT